jgi:hypothetical protein
MQLNLFYVGCSHVTFKILQHVILFTQKNNQLQITHPLHDVKFHNEFPCLHLQSLEWQWT